METQQKYAAGTDVEHPLMVEIKSTIDAMEIKVTNSIELEIAQDFVKQLKDLDGQVHAYWDPDIDKAFSLHRSLTSKRKTMLDKIADIKEKINKKISDYLLEQRRKQQEAEEKERIAAREKEDREKKKLLEAAETARSNGKIEKAESLEERAESHYVAPKPVAPVPQPKGLAQRRTWDPVFEDQSIIPPQYIVIDWDKTTSRLRRAAEDNRGQLKVPGVRFVERIIPVTK